MLSLCKFSLKVRMLFCFFFFLQFYNCGLKISPAEKFIWWYHIFCYTDNRRELTAWWTMLLVYSTVPVDRAARPMAHKIQNWLKMSVDFKGLMLKNKPHLVTFYESTLLSRRTFQLWTSGRVKSTDGNFFFFAQKHKVWSSDWRGLTEMFLTIFTNPSSWVGYDTRSIFKRSLTGLNSEFSFS